MAQFEGNKRIQGTRSHTALVKSGHASPAEEWLVDRRFEKSEFSSVFRNGVLFNYRYGGPGMEEVVIPKGRAVGVSTPVKDFVTKKFKTVLTFPGMALNSNSIGVVPYNICVDKLQVDRFGGNQPAIITQEYITLPYLPNVKPAENVDQSGLIEEEKKITHENKMPWGAVIGKLEVGDYVKVTASGRFTKWKKGTDDASLIAGQALACDLNYEPIGWLKWVQWDEAALREDDIYINRSGASNLPSDGGYPYDPAYKDGNTIDLFNGYHTQGMSNPTGIPGLHDGSGNYDGYGRNDSEYKDMELGTMPDGVEDDAIVYMQALDYAGGKVENLREGIEVKINNQKVEAERLKINYVKGTIAIKAKSGDATQKVTATYKAFHHGTPSYLDFKGVFGAFNILLKY